MVGGLWRLGVVPTLVIAALTATATPTTPAEADFLPLGAAATATRLRELTHRVVGLGCRVESSSGTAVAMADGTLLTNRHVADGARLLNVVPDIGVTATASALVAASADVAVLRVNAPPRANGVELAERDPRRGTRVTVAGYADTYDLHVIPTTVVDVVEGTGRGQPGPVLRLRTLLERGMSGSPVLDEAGRLAGLVFAVEKDTGFTLALPASAIARALTGPHSLQPATRC